MKSFIFTVIILVISTVILIPYINNIKPKKIEIVKSTDNNYVKFPSKNVLNFKKENCHNQINNIKPIKF